MTKVRVWGDLEKGAIKDRLSYDPSSGVLIWISGVRPNKNKTVAGHLSKKGYVYLGLSIRGKVYKFAAHRIVWFLNYGDVPCVLDHINGEKADNRVENLRPANAGLNARNKSPYGASKFKGVYKSGNNWMVQATHSRHRCYLGSFSEELEAAKAYDKWIIKNLRPLERGFSKTNEELGLYK